MLPELPAAFAATRDALHALAEHVVAAAYFHATTHIGLRPTPRGFGTPVFGDGERVRVDGTALVHERAGAERRTEITTLARRRRRSSASRSARPTVYTPTTALDPDAPLAVDHDAALALADWYALGGALLRRPARPSTRELPSSRVADLARALRPRVRDRRRRRRHPGQLRRLARRRRDPRAVPLRRTVGRRAARTGRARPRTRSARALTYAELRRGRRGRRRGPAVLRATRRLALGSRD